MSRRSNYFKSEISTKNLNDRELKILFLIANGKTNSDVALILYLSPNTIKAAVSLIVKKLKAKNRAHAVYLASNEGLFRENQSLFDSFINKF